MIMQANLVVAKYKLMEASNYQAQEMTNKVVAFKYSFDKVITWGLPSFWDGNINLIALEEYEEILKKTKEDFSDINALVLNLKGVVVYKTLYNDYGVLFDLKHIFDDLFAPSYVDHVETEITISAKDHKYPLGKEWGDMVV